MSAASFDTALAFTLQAEGGWSDNPIDKGGPTMKGITLATFRAHFHGTTAAQLRNITDAQVADIYRHGYWNAVKGDDLPAGIDLSAFDMGVNAGPGRSIRLLQSTVNVATDGVLGPISLMAIAAADPVLTIGNLWRRQMSYYEGLSTFGTFGAGWTRRTDERRAAALQLAGAK